VYNGADDDGSGTVALLEIAEAFERQKKVMVPKDLYFSSTLRAKEHALHGSRFYLKTSIPSCKYHNGH
jgi:Zn-dependent M28 family amino/carboxypeptidase